MIDKTFKCHFILNNPSSEVKALIEPFCEILCLSSSSLKDELVKLPEFLNDNDIVVLDGYGFTSTYQKKLRKLVHKLVIIDDKADKRFYADIILNHGDISVLPKYQIESYTNVYSGFPYLIARKEFIKAAKEEKESSINDVAFICMGGTDPFNITLKVLEACLQCDFLREIIVVTGNMYQHKDKLTEMICRTDKSVQNIENANASQLVNLMKKSSVAITTASSIALEVCCVNVPLLCGVVVDNQCSIHSLLLKNGCCITVDNWSTVSIISIKAQLERIQNSTISQKMRDAQAAHVDGKSEARILSLFKQLAS